MAIDARIPLAGVTPNIAANAQQAFGAGQLFAQRAQEQPLRNRLLDAQVSSAENTNTSNQNADTLKNNVTAADMINRYAGSLQNVPPEQLDAQVDGFMNQMRELGYGEFVDQIDIPDQVTPEHLADIQQKLTPFVDANKQLLGRASAKTYAPVPMLDDQGNFAGYGIPTVGVDGQASLQPVEAQEGFTFANPVTMAGDKKSAETNAELDAKIDKEPDLVAAKERAIGDVKQEQEPILAATTAAAKNSIKKSEEAIDSLAKVKTSIINIDEAITAIDNGAKSGPIYSKMPSINKSSIQLDNVRNKMGLDIVGAGSFGALSESELAFALTTAIPDNMEPPELRSWLVRKKAAQAKLAKELEDAAIYLGNPGNTPAGYLEFMRNKPPTGPRQVSTDDEYNSLPSGAEFIDPQGNKRRKP